MTPGADIERVTTFQAPAEWHPYFTDPPFLLIRNPHHYLPAASSYWQLSTKLVSISVLLANDKSMYQRTSWRLSWLPHCGKSGGFPSWNLTILFLEAQSPALPLCAPAGAGADALRTLAHALPPSRVCIAAIAIVTQRSVVSPLLVVGCYIRLVLQTNCISGSAPGPRRVFKRPLWPSEGKSFQLLWKQNSFSCSSYNCFCPPWSL